MDRNDTPKSGVGRRGFFAGLAAGLGIAAIAGGAGKARAGGSKPQPRSSGPVLYRRGEETDRYLKSMF